MVRFTAALVRECPQVTTPLGERALIVRGKGIDMLEAAGGTGGSSSKTDLLYEVACNFDVLDLSNNVLSRLDGFDFAKQGDSKAAAAFMLFSKGASNAGLQRSVLSPVPRLTTLILHNNSLRRISQEAIQSLAPTLHTFVAHGNKFEEKEHLDVFAGLPNLERLSLIDNPVAAKPQYRLYVIARCQATTKLKLLDFNRVLDKERQQADLLSLAPVKAAAPVASNAPTNKPSGGPMSALAAVAAMAKRPVAPRVDPNPAAVGGGEPVRKAHRPEGKLSKEELEAQLALAEQRLNEAETEEELRAIEAEIDGLLVQLEQA